MNESLRCPSVREPGNTDTGSGPQDSRAVPADSREEHRDLDPKELNSAHHHVTLEEDAELQKGMQSGQHLAAAL